MFKHISHIGILWKQRHEPACARLLMTLYWQLVLLVVGLSVITSLGFGAFLLFFHVHQVPEDAGLVTGVDALSREQLKETLSLYEMRKSTYEQLHTNPSLFKDPSVK